MTSSLVSVIRNRFMMLHFPQFINCTHVDFCDYVARENKRIFSLYTDLDFSDIDQLNLPKVNSVESMDTPLNIFYQFIEERFPNASTDTINRACLDIFGYKHMVFDKEDNSQVTSLHNIRTIRHYLNEVNKSLDMSVDHEASSGFLMMNVNDKVVFARVETLYSKVQSMAVNYIDIMESVFGIEMKMSFDDEAKALVIHYTIPDHLNISDEALYNIISEKDAEMSRIIVEECRKATEIIGQKLPFFITVDDHDGSTIFNLTYKDMEMAGTQIIDEAHFHISQYSTNTSFYQPDDSIITNVIDNMNESIKSLTSSLIRESIAMYQDDKVETLHDVRPKPILYID